MNTIESKYVALAKHMARKLYRSYWNLGMYDFEDFENMALYGLLLHGENGGEGTGYNAIHQDIIDDIRLVTHCRRIGHKKTIPVGHRSWMLERATVVENLSFEEEIERDEESQIIRDLVEDIESDSIREIIYRHYMEGESAKKIADDLGTTDSSVWNYTCRGRRILKYQLKRVAPKWYEEISQTKG